MTTALNNRTRDILGHYSELALDSLTNSGNINSGDLSYWTTNNGIASFGSSLTWNAALIALLPRLIGVSRDTNPLSIGGISNAIQSIGIDQEGQFLFNTTAGDTYLPFSPVTISTDAQTITNSIVGFNGPTLGTLTPSGGAGTFGAGTYTVGATFTTAAGLESGVATTSVTLTSAQGILTNAITLPAWATGINWYVNGKFNIAVVAGTAITINSPLTTSGQQMPGPFVNGLAIGYAVAPENYVNAAPPASILGSTTTKIGVIMKPFFPVNYLL